MNRVTTESFEADLWPNGDVWIHTDAHSTKIPKEDCAELAKLLMRPVIQESYKVDYAVSVNEPE